MTIETNVNDLVLLVPSKADGEREAVCDAWVAGRRGSAARPVLGAAAARPDASASLRARHVRARGRPAAGARPRVAAGWPPAHRPRRVVASASVPGDVGGGGGARPVPRLREAARAEDLPLGRVPLARRVRARVRRPRGRRRRDGLRGRQHPRRSEDVRPPRQVVAGAIYEGQGDLEAARRVATEVLPLVRSLETCVSDLALIEGRVWAVLECAGARGRRTGRQRGRPACL